jgi:hypothetical protein
MDNNTLNKRMIQSIVKKAVENIHENPERQIRNLTDLGSMLAKGKYQKQFFDAAEKELAQENSLYYKVATGLIQKTDSDILLTVGTNLGYNSLTYGAKKIRGLKNSPV